MADKQIFTLDAETGYMIDAEVSELIRKLNKKFGLENYTSAGLIGVSLGSLIARTKDTVELQDKMFKNLVEMMTKNYLHFTGKDKK